MNRIELQALSRIRRKESYALLQRKLYPGAYYLIGYSVECGLKACIALQVERHDFPDKNFVNKAHTHSLPILMGLAGLAQKLKNDMKTNSVLERNWLVVKDWSEVSRYEPNITRVQAQDMYSACVARKHGVLAWLSSKW